MLSSESAARVCRVLGHKIDLRTALDLSPYFRDEVVRNASDAYVDEAGLAER